MFFGFSLVVVKAAAKQLTTTTTRGAGNERAVLRVQQRPCFAVFCPDAVACTGGKFAFHSATVTYELDRQLSPGTPLLQ